MSSGIAATDALVVSDHGFATGWFDVARELLDAGLKESPDSRDAVPPHGGEAVGGAGRRGSRRRIET